MREQLQSFAFGCIKMSRGKQLNLCHLCGILKKIIGFVYYLTQSTLLSDYQLIDTEMEMPKMLMSINSTSVYFLNSM